MTTKTPVSNSVNPRKLWLSAASVMALSLALSSPAKAQMIDSDCSPDVAADGAVITCAVAAPGAIEDLEIGGEGGINTITVNIGTEATYTNATGGIRIGGEESVTLNIAEGSTVTGEFGAVNVSVYSGGEGDLTISSLGSISSESTGLRALQQGSGDIVVTTADVVSSSSFSEAISVGNGGRRFGYGDYSGAITLDTTAGAITGAQGIRVNAFGTGDTTVTTGNVTSTGNYGNAVSVFGGYGGYGNFEPGQTTLDTTQGTITSERTGIRVWGVSGATITTGDVTTQGSGFTTAITVFDVGGDLYGGYGVANSTEDSSETPRDLTINTTAGSIVGGEGVSAVNLSEGSTFITTADVTGTGYFGAINAFNGSGSYRYFDDKKLAAEGAYGATDATMDLVIDTTAGTISGYSGITASNLGSGSTSITTADVITGGEVSAAIRVSNGIAPSGEYGGPRIKGGRYGVNSAAVDLTVNTTAGDVSGAEGIQAFNFGAGNTEVTTGDVTSNLNGGTAVFVTNGLEFETMLGFTPIYGGEGVIVGVVPEYGNVFYGANGVDIDVDTTAGAVSGDYGIQVGNYGTGNTTITTADVTGNEDDGVAIQAFNASNAVDLTINTTAGDISAADAIEAFNFGTGSTSITTADVAGGEVGVGISVFNASPQFEDDDYVEPPIILANSGGEGYVGGAVDLTVNTTAGSVSGGQAGIRAANLGSGNTVVTTADVTATLTDGTAISVSHGADPDNFIGGEGGDFGVGPDLFNLSDFVGEAVDLTVNTTQGTVTGGYGIDVVNLGLGNTTITTADVTGSSYGAIYATNGIIEYEIPGGYGGEYGGEFGLQPLALPVLIGGYGADIDVDTTAGTISGYYYGIEVINHGTGNTTITTADVTATATYGTAISATNNQNAVDLTVNTTSGDITGYIGLDIRNDGTGNTNIITADVTSTATYGTAIIAINDENAVDMIVNTTAGDIAGYTGLNIDNEGTGDTTIITGDIAATGSYGTIMYVDDSEYSGAMTVDTTAGSLSGVYGVYIDSRGTGDTTVTTADITVTSSWGYALEVETRENVTGLDVNTSAGVISGGYGVEIEHEGSGDATIITGDVTATANYSDGIDIYGGEASANMTVNTVAGTVTGGSDALDVYHYGAGNLNITTADLTTTGNYGEALEVDGGENTVDIVINTTAGSLSGGRDGIDLEHEGTGSLQITTADVTGEADSGRGLEVRTGDHTTSVSINTTAGSVSGGRFGIYLDHEGTGDVVISTANITTSDNYADGIQVRNEDSSSAGNTTVNTVAGAVSGGSKGIEIDHFTTGDVILTTANVTSENYYGEAIDVWTGYNSNTGSITVDTTAGVVSGSYGINIGAGGEGDTSVTTADVTSSYGDAINVFGSYYSGDIIIDTTAGAITGGEDGIDVRHGGNGNISITVNDVAGLGSGYYGSYYGHGIRTYTSSGTTTITLASDADVVGGEYMGVRSNSRSSSAHITVQGSSGTITGATTGIDIDTSGADILVENLDSVTGNDGDGINARSGGGDITISAVGTILGSNSGIEADSNGGDISIQGSGLVGGITGSGSDGIFADARGGEGGVNIGGITAIGDVSGEDSGILAIAQGSGDIVITTAGEVTANSYGGVTTSHFGSGDTIITIGGDVTGDDYGVDTYSFTGVEITVGAGHTVTGGYSGISTYGVASSDQIDIAGAVIGGVQTFDQTDIVELASTGSVTGGIDLGDENDVFNFGGGSFDKVSGGEGTDTLNFGSGGYTINGSGAAGDDITAFEIFNFDNSGFTLAGAHVGLIETNFNSGVNTLSGSLSSGDVNIMAGATLDASDGASITGDLNNDGTLTIAGTGIGTASVDGDLNLSDTSTLTFDRTGETDVDLLEVSGDVNLDGSLVVNQTDIFAETVTLIDGGAALNGDFDTVSGLINGLLVTQELELDPTTYDVNIVSEVLDLTLVDGLDENQISLATALFDELRAQTGDPDLQELAVRFAGLATLEQITQAANALSPDAGLAGVDVYRNSQLMFMNALFRQTEAAGGSAPRQTAGLMSLTPMNNTGSGAHFWGGAQYVSVEHDAANGASAFETDGFEFTLGVSGRLDNGVGLGVAAGFADLTSEAQGGSASEVGTEIFRLGGHANIGFNENGDGLNTVLDATASYASGSQKVLQDISSGGLGLSGTQAADADITGYGALIRLAMTGMDGKSWPVKPFLMAGADSVSQDGFSIGSGATALNVQDYDGDRYTLGYGAIVEQQLENGLKARLSATAMHHSGDTETGFISSFVGSTNNITFETLGNEIEAQYVLDGALTWQFDNSWTADVTGYVETGDLEGYGARFTLGTRF